MAEHMPLLVAALFALFVASSFWSLSHLLGPRNRAPEKMIPYECGSDTAGTRDVRLSIKFYPAVVLFLLFDAAAVFVYLWTTALKDGGWPALLAFLPFFLVTVPLMLFYAIRKGAFQWRS